MDNKTLILLVGKSGSGKTTIAEYLSDKYGLKMLDSYTTRKPRYEGEKGHIFITHKEYLRLENKVAHTYFDGNYYCATSEQCDECDVCVIDVAGVETLKKYYRGDKQIAIFYLDVNAWTRFRRMMKRGDGFKKAMARIWHDYKVFKPLFKRTDVMFIRNYNDVRMTAAELMGLVKQYF